MSRVLFATDLSEAAGVAEHLIGSIAWPQGTSVQVVTVVPWLPALVGTPWVAVAPLNTDEIQAAQVAEAERTARAVAERLATHALDASWVVMRGQAADAIVDLARREAVDLIVLGSRGLGALEGALLGSVSEAVADRAPCPVLIARSAGLTHSLIADDGSPGAELAVAYVQARPHLLGSVARLIAVNNIADAWAETIEMPIDAHSIQVIADDRRQLWHETRAALARAAVRLREAGESTEIEVEEGRPGNEIVDAALRWPADLVVVGTRHRTGITRLVLGSVGRHVLHHSHCSVLLVGHLPSAEPGPAQDQDAAKPLEAVAH